MERKEQLVRKCIVSSAAPYRPGPDTLDKSVGRSCAVCDVERVVPRTGEHMSNKLGSLSIG
jgi:hypothetical protein